MKVITLQRPAVCADCGAELPAGTKARYYSADRIYCESHDEPAAGETAAKPARPPGPKTSPLFPDDSPDTWIQFLEEVQEALTNLIGRLRGKR
ncbi:hypothetical protein ES705_07850 [subsurface metagenome]|jgi:hypothetical protein